MRVLLLGLVVLVGCSGGPEKKPPARFEITTANQTVVGEMKAGAKHSAEYWQGKLEAVAEKIEP